MPEFRETVEELRAAEAGVRQLFGSDNRVARGNASRLVEAADFINEVYEGRRPMTHLREAMSTSDFPILFAQVLDRQILGAYREMQPVWQNYIGRTTVPDFRSVERFALDGAEGRLPEVDELEEYPEAALQESRDTFKVRKYGRRLDLSWEAMVNDDLDAFRRNPERLARGARRTEQFLATTLYVDATGPRADLYTGANGNVVPGNPELTREGLEAALNVLNSASDVDGEPIVNDYVNLVIPPALEVTANNILQATVYRQTVTGGEVEVRNWLQNRLRVYVDPYIPRVATGPEGSSSWFLFSDPNDGRAFGLMAFLRGYETPALYERAPNARRIGGGEVAEAFEDDSVAWRVRHVVGGGLLLNTGGAAATVASDGSSSS